MTFLNLIPTELLDDIVSYLDGPDLASISLVTRRLQLIAEPILYRVVHLTYDGSTPSAFRLFCSSILNNPDRARHVQVLVLRWAEDGGIETCITGSDRLQFSYLDNQPVPQEPYTSTATGSESADLSKTSSWIEYLTASWRKWSGGKCKDLDNVLKCRDMNISTPVPDVLFLLYLLPSLQCLEIFAHEFSLETVTNFILYQHSLLPASLPMSLRSLRELRIESIDRCGLIGPFTILTMFQLPSLRKLNISHVDIEEPEPPYDHCEAGTSPITHLSIRPNNSSESLLAPIIAYPRALTHLELVYTIGNNSPLDGPLFGTILQPVRNTLEQLTIYLSNCPKIRLDETADYIIGSLHDWPVLRRVRCPLVVLLGTDWEYGTYILGEVLPKVIVEFVVEVDDFCGSWHVVDQVLGLMRRKKECGLELFRELAVLGVEGDDIKRIKASCVEAGVELVRGKVLWDILGHAVDEEQYDYLKNPI